MKMLKYSVPVSAYVLSLLVLSAAGCIDEGFEEVPASDGKSLNGNPSKDGENDLAGISGKVTFDPELGEFVQSVTDATPQALCIRSPFGPGKVNWRWNVNGSEWSYEVEDGSLWIGASAPSDNTDGIHRNGWGCTVLKIPNHCTADVNSNGSFSHCCNAAASVVEGVVRWEDYTAIGAPRPPGCRPDSALGSGVARPRHAREAAYARPPVGEFKHPFSAPG